MNGRETKLPMMTLRIPEVGEAEHLVRQARQMFTKTLAQWASDVLEVRRLQLHRLEWQPERCTESWSKAA